MRINLRKIRKDKGLSLEQLSKLCGHPKSTLSAIENNLSDPKISTICDIARALKVPLDELVNV